jgi:hypothetical protein
VSDATFASPDLTTFTRLDELGLAVVGQCLEPGRAVLACRVLEEDRWCRRCGCEGASRDGVLHRLAHEPFGWQPTVLPAQRTPADAACPPRLPLAPAKLPKS